MDIKELRKLINEVKQERKLEKNLLSENVDEAFLGRFRNTQANLNKDALDILFNLLVNREKMSDSSDGAPSWTKQTIENLYDIINNKFVRTGALGEPEKYKKQLNIAAELFSKASGRKKYTNPNDLRNLYSKLESDQVMNSVIDILRQIGVSDAFVEKFLSNSERDLGLNQLKTNPGTPSAKQGESPVNPFADTKIPSRYMQKGGDTLP